MSPPVESGVLHGSKVDDIAQLAARGLCAVILAGGDRSTWLDDLADMVVAERLVIPRTTLPSVTPDDFMAWACTVLAGTPTAVAGPLLDDMTEILTQVVDQERARRVMVRVFTEAPTRRCGFHVDTVPPQAPTIGAVRVYNGPTTQYVASDDVLGMADFYAYLSRRERLSRETVRPGHAETALTELLAMDENPSFLRPGAAIHHVPPNATVYFRHIDVRRHWSPHPVSDAWIHRSPMSGKPRLVLNVSPALAAPGHPGRR
ncbi:hypothetical protein AR457_38470 [Streptomyces agglomeratus]|uniref:hypothetical protein n=1 Tax=Streptomyces agglomeratus TaxID=285458 RepID=UPI000854DC0E|nr:hypothetical protein [Streptomyces agglomeratus]OEJ23072.1 hypothetical protein AR457_38470 [Streptomyces agglomeratus]